MLAKMEGLQIGNWWHRVSSLIARPTRAFNSNPIWNREVRFEQRTLRAPTFDRWLYVKLHKLGLMGKEDFEFFRTHLKPGMTVVDAGANIGLYSIVMADLVGPTGRIFAFEPSPTLFEAAIESIRRNGMQKIVRLENVGLGSKPGNAVLYRTNFNSGDNRLVSSSRHTDGVPVRIASLDDILPDYNVDWVKIDVQGWEFEVFRGMEKMLSRNRSTRLYFEFWPFGLRHAGEDPAALLQWLVKLDFAIYRPGADLPLNQEDIFRIAAGQTTVNFVAAAR